MLESLCLAIGLLAPDLTAPVAVEAAYVLHTTASVDKTRCCGACKNGIITHGDGHKTQCPCPEDCPCKTKGAVTHNPVIIKCEGGACALKR
jgi:hypothetical protein